MVTILGWKMTNSFNPGWKIHTNHYRGPASPEPVVENHYTEASKKLIKSPSFGFLDPNGMDYSIDLTKMGPWVIYASASKKTAFLEEDFRKYGLAHSDDESMDRMGGWIGATYGSHAVECVKPSPEIGLFELPEHIPSYSKYSAMPDVNVPIKHLYGTVPINKVGFYVSKIANAEEHARNLTHTNYLYKRPGHNPETEALLERLDVGREITALGVENLENAAAGLDYGNGTSKLFESTHIYRKAVAIAQARGLYGKAGIRKETIDEIIRYFWKHELVHNSDYREWLSESQKEIYVGEFLAEFFGERAEIVDEKLARIYRKLAEENEDYAEGFRGRIKSSNARSRIEYLAEKYTSEAKAMGMDEAEARDYVECKLEQEVEELEKSNLEETVEGNKAEAEESNNMVYLEKEMSDEDPQGQEANEEAADEAPAE